MLGSAATTGFALDTGFARAQRAAHTADIVAHFSPIEQDQVDARISTLANVAGHSYRLVVRPVDFGIELGPGRHGVRVGTAEVDGLEPGHEHDGLAIVAGRPLAQRGAEAVIERGLADAWHARIGERIGLREHRRLWIGTIVGIAVEPDDVAYPLASRPRVYVPYALARALSRLPGREPINAAYIRVVRSRLLPETLVAARSQSFGLHDLTFTTRAGVRAIVDQAGGLVVALLSAFAVIALLAAAAMLAASGHARVTRDLATIGALRAIGFSARGLAWSYALEAMITAAPAVTLGVVGGSFLVSGPTTSLLHRLNELPPAHTLGIWQAAAAAAATVLAGVAAGWPALLAARQPVAGTLRGAHVSRPRGRGVVGRPAWLGARLALSRPGRLAVGGLAIAVSVSVVFLMLGLAHFLLEAERNPSVIGERYTLLVSAPPGGLQEVLATKGVAAAAERYEVGAADSFDLGQPMSVVAFGPGGGTVFSGRPLLEGRRAHATGEFDVGRGLADSLGLALGSPVIGTLADGTEFRGRVVGIVQELAEDGRIAYTPGSTLLDVDPTLVGKIAVRLEPGVNVPHFRSTLRSHGFSSTLNSGLAPKGSTFLQTIVVLLRTVAVVDGFVCAALVLLSLVVLSRERSATIGIVRAIGGSSRDIAALLAGAAFLLLVIAVPAGYALERWILAPALSQMVERYGSLPLTPSGLDDLLVVCTASAVAVGAALTVAIRQGRVTVVDALRAE
jgi:ABC-type antimicrobial peptide transport system permease subunit